MSKDKIGKKDKLKKYDLFSIMMEQSTVFRDMVASFQGSFGFQPEALATRTSERPLDKPAASQKRGKASKGTKTTKKAKPARKSAKSAAAPAVKKAVPAKKTARPAAKKVATKAARKTASKKVARSV